MFGVRALRCAECCKVHGVAWRMCECVCVHFVALIGRVIYAACPSAIAIK